MNKINRKIFIDSTREILVLFIGIIRFFSFRLVIGEEWAYLMTYFHRLSFHEQLIY